MINAERTDDIELDDDAETLMHVYIGVWHRRTPNLIKTACGIAIDTQYAPLRHEELTGDLCSECFTAFELRLAALAFEAAQDEHERLTNTEWAPAMNGARKAPKKGK